MIPVHLVRCWSQNPQTYSFVIFEKSVTSIWQDKDETQGRAIVEVTRGVAELASLVLHSSPMPMTTPSWGRTAVMGVTAISKP